LVGHLAEPGQGPQALWPLANLPESGVHRVLLSLGAEYLGRCGEGFFVD
jgi:hypothetical protein